MLAELRTGLSLRGACAKVGVSPRVVEAEGEDFAAEVDAAVAAGEAFLEAELLRRGLDGDTGALRMALERRGVVAGRGAGSLTAEQALAALDDHERARLPYLMCAALTDAELDARIASLFAGATRVVVQKPIDPDLLTVALTRHPSPDAPSPVPAEPAASPVPEPVADPSPEPGQVVADPLAAASQFALFDRRVAQLRSEQP